jgi:hypothetical protein
MNIEKTGETVLSLWHNRRELAEKMRAKKDFDERKRSIYYDTDNIREEQKETVKICCDCAGALKIDSTSDRGTRLLAVHIPLRACGKCRDLGYIWYHSAELNCYDMVFLQDRTEDSYLERT